MHRSASNETTLVSEIPNIMEEKNIIIARGQRKTLVSILSDKFCEGQAFRHLLPKGEFGFNVPRNIPVSAARYFNQRLFIFNQYFTSDADYIFFPGLCMSSTSYVYQKTLLCIKLKQVLSRQDLF